MAPATDRAKCAHLLRRFALGASEAEIDFYLKNGLDGAVELLLNPAITDEPVELGVEALQNDKGRLNMGEVVAAWTARLLTTRKPLQERMTLFWHNHFATSASKVGNPYMMAGQNAILRRNALGKFPDLLLAVSRDPAMILWLDNQENYKGHANENFAREVMELFTLGIGHYTEKDVQEAARAFTGWTLDRTKGKQTQPEFLFRKLRHDDGTKTVLGNTGPFTGEDVLNILTGNPRTARFIVTKLWDAFVWPLPDAKTIEPFAKRFYESGLDIQVLLRDVMKSKEFYSPRAMRALVKSPVDVSVVTMRQLGIGEKLREVIGATPTREVLRPAVGAVQTMKSMGMWLMYPPDVSGWKTGQYWISSATMVERIGWGDKLFGGGKNARYPIRYPAFALLQGNPTPEGVVSTLVSIFDVEIKPEHRKVLVAAATKAIGDRLTVNNANATASAVTKLLFATAEFQFC